MKIGFTSWSNQSPQPPLKRGNKPNIELKELLEIPF